MTKRVIGIAKPLFRVRSSFAANANYVEIHCRLYVIWICVHRKHSLLAEALFLLFADGRKETSAMGRKWLY